jgi:hypothetical protein
MKSLYDKFVQDKSRKLFQLHFKAFFPLFREASSAITLNTAAHLSFEKTRPLQFILTLSRETYVYYFAKKTTWLRRIQNKMEHTPRSP